MRSSVDGPRALVGRGHQRDQQHDCAGGYARRVEDTVAIHRNPVAVVKEMY